MNSRHLINSFLLPPLWTLLFQQSMPVTFSRCFLPRLLGSKVHPPRTVWAIGSGLSPCLGKVGGRGATLRREWGSSSPWLRQNHSLLSVPTGTAINAKGGVGFNDVDTCSPRNGLKSIWHESLPRLLSHKLLFHKGKAALFINCCR